jgi:serine/threonine protein kinase
MYCIDMEFCDFTLHQYISGDWFVRDDQTPSHLQGKRGPYDILRITTHIVCGVMVIHRNERVHRDLKPENSKFRIRSTEIKPVLYSAKENQWKIGDLGITARGSPNDSIATQRQRGTIPYLPPEFLEDSQYNYYTDIWALGCIIYELCTGQKAFNNIKAIQDFTLSGNSFPRERFPFAGSDADFLYDLIQRLLQLEHGSRPKIQDVSTLLDQHPYDQRHMSRPYAYIFNDWLFHVGNKIHHIRSLCQADSGSEVHEVSILFAKLKFRFET